MKKEKKKKGEEKKKTSKVRSDGKKTLIGRGSTQETPASPSKLLWTPVTTSSSWPSSSPKSNTMRYLSLSLSHPLPC